MFSYVLTHRYPYQNIKTSFARSATLEDTSWDRLTTELTSWNLPDSHLHLNSKTEPSVTKHQTTLGRGGITKKKRILGGGHRKYFLDGGNNWGGDTTQH